MSKISLNIRHLRSLKKLTQDELSVHLDINRSRLGAYEEGRSEPPIEMLIRISDYFHIAIDALVKGDLRKTDPDALMKIGKNRLLFPVQVDVNNSDIIEVVPIKASAGYLNGYADPEFVQSLSVMHLPFKIVGKHRAFGIKGDSMPPLKDGAMIVSKYVESLDEIKDGQTYVVLTKDDGLVYKRLYRENKKTGKAFVFQSDNPVYSPYVIGGNDILEVWSFVCSLNITEFKPEDLNMESVIRFLQSYKVEMRK